MGGRGLTTARAQLGVSTTVIFGFPSDFRSNPDTRRFFRFYLRSVIFGIGNFIFGSFVRFPFNGSRREGMRIRASQEEWPLKIPNLGLCHGKPLEELSRSDFAFSPDSGSPLDEQTLIGKFQKEKDPISDNVVHSFKKQKRLGVDFRTTLSKAKARRSGQSRKWNEDREKVGMNPKEVDIWSDEVDKLIANYSLPWFSWSLNWKRIPNKKLLNPSEHDWLTELLRPMKIYKEKRRELTKILRREPSDAELAKALHLSLRTVKRHLAAGRAAKNMLLERNLKLVLWEVFRLKFLKEEFEDMTLEFADLCNEGLKGMLVALDRYQPERNIKFSTYAFYWIRHHIRRAIAFGSLLSFSNHSAWLRVKLRSQRLRFRKLYGRDPTAEELRKRMDLDPEKFKLLWKAAQKPVKMDVENLESENEETLSWWIENGVYPLEDDNPRDPRVEVKNFVDDMFDILTPRERLVISKGYGLDGEGKKSFRYTAKVMDLSYETIRKDFSRAIVKIKDPSRIETVSKEAHELIHYLDRLEGVER